MAIGEVFADEVVLAGEGVVQRALGDAGVGDDAVDADGVDALAVEQVVRGVRMRSLAVLRRCSGLVTPSR